MIAQLFDRRELHASQERYPVTSTKPRKTWGTQLGRRVGSFHRRWHLDARHRAGGTSAPRPRAGPCAAGSDDKVRVGERAGGEPERPGARTTCRVFSRAVQELELLTKLVRD